MPGLIIQDFSGIAPKVNERMLADNLATEAVNCQFESGTLKPYRAVAVQEQTAAGTESIFYYKKQKAWIAWTSDVDVVGVLMPQDKYDRIYYTDALFPKVRSLSSIYRLGIPRGSEPVVEVIESDYDEADKSNTALLNTRYFSYRVCYVDAFGFEGPPSAPTAPVTVGRNPVIKLQLPAPPTGNYNWDASKGSVFRIYRANKATNSAVYQFAADVPINSASWDDEIDDDALQEVIPSTDWIGPPDDDQTLYPKGPLRGLVEMPNGVLAGFSGNEVCVCEPYLPHAWPLANRRTTSHEIVGLVSIQQGLLVCTTAMPYLLMGTTPSAMALVPLEDALYPCLSKQSIVDMGGYAIYASNDGLVAVQGNSASVLTENIFSRTQWQQDYTPDQIRAFQYEGTYIGFIGKASSEQKAFMFDPRGGTDAFVLLENFRANTAFYREDVDKLIIATHKPKGYEGSTLYYRAEWAGADPDDEYRWTSKQYRTSTYLAMSVARVQAENYPVTFELEGDGQLYASITVNNEDAFRLPSGRAAKDWKISVRGVGEISFVGVWDSMAEVI